MTQSQKMIRSHPLVSYFALAYAISWTTWAPAIAYFLQHRPIQIPSWLFLLGWVGSYGPTFSALIITGIEQGVAGVRRLLSRLLVWRIGFRWYALILLVPAAIRLGAIFLYAQATRLVLEPDLSLGFMVFPIFITALPFGPLAEETGWRGYALPRLQASRGGLIGGIILGLLWAFWHTPVFLVPGMALPPVPPEWSVIVNYTLRVVAVSVLFTWVYNNTGGSLLVSVLFHAAVNAMPAAITPMFFGEISVETIHWLNWLTAGFEWAFVAVVVIVFGGNHLLRRPI